MVLGFVLKSPAKQAESDTHKNFGWRAEHRGISVFGTIHPHIFQLGAPIGSQPPVDHVHASFDKRFAFQVGSSDAGTNEHDILADTPASARWNASFDEHFASFLVGSSDAAANEQDILAGTPVSAWNASFTERLGSPGDDGRTAIYDIAARAVYLPDGRRLEAHSGLGSFRDDPRHAHVRSAARPRRMSTISLCGSDCLHGVHAIRLTPVDESRMFGRDGILSILHARPRPVERMCGLQKLSRVPECLPPGRGHPSRRSSVSKARPSPRTPRNRRRKPREPFRPIRSRRPICCCRRALTFRPNFSFRYGSKEFDSRAGQINARMSTRNISAIMVRNIRGNDRYPHHDCERCSGVRDAAPDVGERYARFREKAFASRRFQTHGMIRWLRNR